MNRIIRVSAVAKFIIKNVLVREENTHAENDAKAGLETRVE